MEAAKEWQKYNDRVAAFRLQEYPVLRSNTYLDHAGTTPPSRSMIEAFSKESVSTLITNPHSASTLSHATSQTVDDIRVRLLRFFGANPAHFDVIFVANATAGIKLVAEAFRDHPRGFRYAYHKDSHTSLVGVRELARHGSICFKSNSAVEEWFEHGARNDNKLCPILFAFPGQSNMNGKRLPLKWTHQLHLSNPENAFALLDAAALASTASLDFNSHEKAAHFTVISLYKIFGFPELGALIVKNSAAHLFNYRRYFGGGTVDVVSVLDEQWHISKSDNLHSRLEDGTLPLRGILSLQSALDSHKHLFISQSLISQHTSFLARFLYNNMKNSTHENGSPVFKIYADPQNSYEDSLVQGPILAFNLCDQFGYYHSPYEVSKLASLKGIQMRVGTLCNPGGVADALATSTSDLRDAYDAGFRCGAEGDLRDGQPMAMLRVSFGASSILQDVHTFMSFIEEFFLEARAEEPLPLVQNPTADYYIKSITVYPIKSCAGWLVPPGVNWPVWEEGLAWDRHWSLFHQGAKSRLNQKRCPRMALMRPSIDLSTGLLCISYVGSTVSSLPNTISIALDKAGNELCKDNQNRIRNPYGLSDDDTEITEFFTGHLGVPCQLARISTSSAFKNNLEDEGITRTHISSEPMISIDLPIPGSFPTPPRTPPPAPRTFSNDSPILAISQASVDYINRFNELQPEQINSAASGNAAAIDATVFRANILLAMRTCESTTFNGNRAFEEETWSSLQIYRPSLEQMGDTVNDPQAVTNLEVSGRCQRCQMICINQQDGTKQPDSFVTLAKLRRGEKGVAFGIHCRLSRNAQETPIVRVGDWAIGSSGNFRSP